MSSGLTVCLAGLELGDGWKCQRVLLTARKYQRVLLTARKGLQVLSDAWNNTGRMCVRASGGNLIVPSLKETGDLAQ